MPSSIQPRYLGRRQNGIGLIEVLIAVIVLAVGLLGIAALQAITLKNSGGSAERTQAVIQTYSLLDLLRANKATVSTYTTGDSFACGSYQPPTPNGGTAPTPNANLTSWLSGLQTAIGPSACAKVACITATANTDCTITTRWDASGSTGGRIVRSGETVATGEATLQTLEIKGRL